MSRKEAFEQLQQAEKNLVEACVNSLKNACECKGGAIEFEDDGERPIVKDPESAGDIFSEVSGIHLAGDIVMVTLHYEEGDTFNYAADRFDCKDLDEICDYIEINVI